MFPPSAADLMNPFLFCRLACVLSIAAGIRAEAAPQVLAGEIAGARYAIARPEQWNGQILLFAHGLRPDGGPLDADLELGNPTYARLLTDGWIVATTSYRRNGILVRDAIDDLDALRDLIERDFGPLTLVLLMGDSMGGAIVTLMAERSPGRFHGAVAVGAALQVRDAENPLVPSAQPRIPLLFLSNRSERAGPSDYVATAAAAPVPPALWTVERDGHVNVNHAERTRAIDALVEWITTNQIERERDATTSVPLANHPAVEISDGAAHGRVQEVTDDYGNIFTNYTAEDLARVGVNPGDEFQLEARGRSWRVRYGTNYTDVPRGEWVAFLRAEGVMLFAICYGNASATSGVHAGDVLVVRPAAPH